ncbi:MAG: type II toxin-antitoxin system VapC family toxin [Corynebacterium sp.]|uniref:type II toxin-antitoxin system VapC family toxin n=1 Tax=Corynebacterium sp. TaxID=1720 RepID=UPI0026DFEF83|nr:type II toxin-antitoxin system VapC family toxin [Corynebacterium sp.]MDO5670687.1 type II toxin-antitoxin system VapC family toxin [Corynebacterium sp.]
MIYLDTSAAFKLLFREAESAALIRFLRGHVDVMSSSLLLVEAARACVRVGVEPAAARSMCDGVDLIAISDEIIDLAAGFTEHLKSLDAIHLATALFAAKRGAEITVVTYDRQLAAAVKRAGLSPVSPGVAQ